MTRAVLETTASYTNGKSPYRNWNVGSYTELGRMKWMKTCDDSCKMDSRWVCRWSSEKFPCNEGQCHIDSSYFTHSFYMAYNKLKIKQGDRDDSQEINAFWKYIF